RPRDLRSHGVQYVSELMQWLHRAIITNLRQEAGRIQNEALSAKTMPLVLEVDQCMLFFLIP
ncbi:MAG: hypothetical protein AAB604_03110, partial [Patescibacteria group bacterium]